MAQSKAEKGTSAKKSENGQPNRLEMYFRQTRGELRKVTWPSRQESQRLTAIVLGVTILMALFLGIWDLVFSTAVNALVQFVVGA
ncbi:MAG: preprotein translocase subunit SecE [Chloroflexi bacterium]|nr:preprotein translocase subunit SecE [Chloroflexota bacterium]MCI0644668.1 preprotein translocase subunit SecE [Chloroflexota bacterium]MCI0730366.1 preprotein translocase subunit SecE [Chloroflexota bacterium]